MKLSSVLQVKNDILAGHYRTLGQEFFIRAEADVIPNYRDRLMVGHSVMRLKETPDAAEYRLEVRLQSETGSAAETAFKWKDRLGGEISIAIVSGISAVQDRNFGSLAADAGPNGNAAKERPLRIGLSIGRADSWPGTLGCFVSASGSSGILSNSHVLALAGGAQVKDAIYQPGIGGDLTASSQIAELIDFTILQGVGVNGADCAWAGLISNEHDGNTIPSTDKVPSNLVGKKLRSPVAPEALGPAPWVCKIGRSTGFTKATLSAALIDDVPITVPYKGTVRFDGLVEITWDTLESAFSQPGDSGSVFFGHDSLYPLGLHIGGGIIERDGRRTGVSYGCNLIAALDAMGVRFLLS